jgi:hypothetical protein
MPTTAELHESEDEATPGGADRRGSAGGRRPGSGVSVVDRETGAARRRPTTTTRSGSSGSTEPIESTEPAAQEVPEVDPDHRAAPKVITTGSHRVRPRWRRAIPWALAGLGLVGTLAFGHAWASQRASLGQQAQVQTVSRDFLLALTNFDAKNVDADFSRIQGYATGAFASQSNQFFGSTIRTQLEAALASSRGQIRSQYVQSVNGNQASVYSVVDQTYVNNKMTSPSADELRIDTNLTKVGGSWKVAAVTVLNNASGSSSSSGTSSSGASSSGSGG